VNQINTLINYLNLLNKIISDSDLTELENLFHELKTLFDVEGKLFLAGNGGSAAISNHADTDLSKLVHNDKRLQVINLVGNISKITAYANDEGYENVFSNVIQNYSPTDKDVVLAFSSSGNSDNIINLINYCNSNNIKIFCLLGFDGGKAKEICSNSITFNSSKKYYGPIEDLHMIIIHLFSHIIKNDLQELK
jgi:D-sedoheptulose 7-phosphate isomerase